MPPIRDHNILFDDDDDDDGMPPLVENPNPSMTFTFFTDMTPITFSSTTTDVYPEIESPTLTSPPGSPLSPQTDVPATPPGIGRVSHGKKRDASYIPRPPNAFILFRSSFIKSQQVPGKVEGNHSTLSKIIGMYWKTLPREEREQWEAKAVIAQAEHRKRYPDWRFRPGANAIAKLKVKDGTLKKRHGHSRKKKQHTKEIENTKAKRCAKIANLLVQGKKGPALEAAVKEWEGRQVETTDSEEDTLRSDGRLHKPSQSDGEDHTHHQTFVQEDKLSVDATDENTKTRSKTPDALSDARFKVHLTSMFRRSLSAPASQSRSPFSDILSAAAAAASPAGIPPHVRRDTASTELSLVVHALYGQQKQHEAATSPDIDQDSLTGLTSTPLLSCPQGCPTRCNDPFARHHTAFAPFSPTSALDPDPTSPSSPTTLDGLYLPPNSPSLVEEDSQGKEIEDNADLGMPYTVYKYQPQAYSSYSSLNGWDRVQTSRNNHNTASSSVPYTSLEPSFTLANIGGNNNWTAATNRNRNSGGGASGTNLAGHVSVFNNNTLPWYGTTEGDTRSNSGAVPIPFVGEHNDKVTNTSSNETRGVVDKYAFFPTNVI